MVCFVGRVAYEKYIGSKEFSFGVVMHFPLRGEAIVRTRELQDVLQAAPDQSRRESLRVAI